MKPAPPPSPSQPQSRRINPETPSSFLYACARLWQMALLHFTHNGHQHPDHLTFLARAAPAFAALAASVGAAASTKIFQLSYILFLTISSRLCLEI